MADQISLILEAEKRGLAIPEEKQSLVNEARRRGLIPSLSMEALTPEQKVTETARIEQEQQENIKSAKRAFVEEAPETIGGIVGGVGGALVGGVPGAIVGAGAGGAFGEFVSQTRTEDELDPRGIAISGARQAAFEAGGRVVIGVAGKVLSPFGKTITPEGQAAKELLDQFTPRNTISVLPAQITESRTLDLMQNVAEKSLIGGGEIAEFKNVTNPKVLDSMIDDLVSRFGASAEPDVLGEAVEQIVSGNLKTSRLPAQTIYNTISERLASKGDIVSTKSLKDFAGPLLEKAKKLGGISSANSGDDVVKGIMDLPDSIDYATAQDLRSRLIAKADEFLATNKKAPAIGKSKRLASLTDGAIERALKTNDRKALVEWRKANEIWRDTGEQFNNKFIRGLIKEAATKGNPEIIASKIFKPGGISNIRKIRSAVDDKTFQQLKRWHVDSLLKKSVDKEGQLVGDSFFNSMFGKAGMGEQTMKEIYTPAEIFALKDSASALKVIQKKQAEGGGGMFIQLAQPAAFIGILTGNLEPLSVTVLGGPAVLAKIMTHPKGSKWLLSTAKLPPGSPEAFATLAKISDLALRIRQELGDTTVSDTTKEGVKFQDIRGTSTLK